MSIPMKDNEHISSNPQEFQEAYIRARTLFEQIEGVVGVGFGQKQTGGQYTGDISIIVFVLEKKNEEDLVPEQRISPAFEGYKTDVVTVPIAAMLIDCDDQTQYSTIQGGIRITPERRDGKDTFGSGTLGCIVRRRGDTGRENVYLLSCKHVLFANGAKEGNYVYHPNAPDPRGSSSHANSLGPIQDVAFKDNLPYTYMVNGTSTTTNLYLDCATALINIDSQCCGSTCTKDTTDYDKTILDLQIKGKNTIADVRSVVSDHDITKEGQNIVYKVGVSSGKTGGKVVRINSTVGFRSDPDDPTSPIIHAKGMIEIDYNVTREKPQNCKEHAWFAEHGDSGSLVLDEAGNAIGLLTIGPPTKKPNGEPNNDPGPSFACHIVPILDRLNICIPADGTSHGSSQATDGSGLTLLSLRDFPLPDGEIVFTTEQTAGALVRSPAWAEPVPVTKDEERHMRALLADLRTTQKGRELHAVFAEVRREIGYLVRNCRPVKVVWHRNKGPAFLAHTLNHLKGHTDHIPQEVNGVALHTLLARMGEALRKYGSHPLCRAIEQHGDDLLAMLTIGNCCSIQDCVAYLKHQEASA